MPFKMFQFGFFENKTGGNTSAESHETTKEWFPAKQRFPCQDYSTKKISEESIKSFNYGDISINYLTSNIKSVLSGKLSCPLLEADGCNSDLMPAVYEGGLKVWECTYDLVHYITDEKIDLSSKSVMDLGCGSGIVGILACIKGSSSVCFQDYNEEVIDHVTIPNVYLNADSDRISEVCKFYCGDWYSFSELGEEHEKFDYIFTSETIYNPDNYTKLHTVFKQKLKLDGAVYLAAKTHYFGVGGGLRQFEDFLEREDTFSFSSCWKCSSGLQREILKITFK